MARKTGWHAELASRRIVFMPEHMLPLEPATFFSNEGLGLLFRMLPYVTDGNGYTERDLQRFCPNQGTARFRRCFNEVRSLFVESPVGVFKLSDDIPWLRVQNVVARPSVRQFMAQLVEFWQGRCAYCGTENGQFEIDHIVPKSRGGSDELTNLALSCRSCNSKKRARTAAEFGHPHVHDMAARIQ